MSPIAIPKALVIKIKSLKSRDIIGQVLRTISLLMLGRNLLDPTSIQICHFLNKLMRGLAKKFGINLQ